MLNTQYRMHPSISAFPSKEFYDEALKNGTVSDTGAVQSNLSPPQSRHLSRRTSKVTGQIPSVLFIHHDHWESVHDRSRANFQEMRIAIAILEDLLISNPEMKGKDIGIIAPYVAQIRMLDSILKTDPGWEESFKEQLGDLRALQMKEIEVKTVDGFEGREKEVIIFSTVRNNPWGAIGFLADRRRMNVALTRAKRALFVLGSMTTLSQSRYAGSSEDPKKEVAKMVVQSTGDEWKNFIKFVLAEELFTEFDRPPEYRSQEEMLAFEWDCKPPTQWENGTLVATS
jgi:superfamily I DNA and/or RNA helicase